jgi:hypothetical protein
MSYGIVRIQKFTAGSVKGIQIHDHRQKNHSHTNSDIDWKKTKDNYTLKGSLSFRIAVNERIKHLDLKKAVRKDAVVMAQCLVTSDKQFFDKLNIEQRDDFFNKAYDWITDRYGNENIISATVHLDEKTPHMHVNFVPVTSDGRLCAKDLLNRNELNRLHDDFYKDVGSTFGLERGETRDQKKKHLSVEEYKLGTQRNQLKEQLIGLNVNKINLKRQEDELEKQKQTYEMRKEELTRIENALEKRIKTHNDQLKDLRSLDTITKKNTIMGLISVSRNDFDYLFALAQKGILYDGLKKDHDILETKCKKLEKEVKGSLHEKLAYEKKMNDLIERSKKLDIAEKLIEDIDMELEYKAKAKFFLHKTPDKIPTL